MRAVLCVVLIAGCDRVFALEHLDLERDAASDAAPDGGPPPPTCLRDNFDAAMLDRVAWSPYDETNMPVALVQQNGELAITLASNMPGTSNGLVSNGKYSMYGGSFELEMTEVPTGVNSEAGFDVAFTSANYYLIVVSDGSLVLQVMLDGARSTRSLPYSATAHRYLRIVHDVSPDEVGFEVSGNRSTWTRVHTLPRRIPLFEVLIDIYAGSYGTGDATPGRARFDNALLINADCPPP